MTIVKVKHAALTGLKADVLVIPVHEDEERGSGFTRADRQLDGLLEKAAASGTFRGKAGETCIQQLDGAKIAATRVALIGLGKREEMDLEKIRRLGSACHALLETRARSADVLIDDVASKPSEADETARAFAIGLELTRYRFDRFKKSPKPELRSVTLVTSTAKRATAMRAGVKVAGAVANGVAQARDLANLPGNHGRPKKLAAAARSMARATGLTCRVLGPTEMKKLGMGSLLSVSLGSPHPPQLIVLEHKPKKKDVPTVCLVGKGLTFDSGGISIKPSADMDKMRYDKCGGTTVIGTMRAVAELGLPLHVVGHRAVEREHARRRRQQAGRRRRGVERQDDRDPEHRCRGPPDPRRRAGLLPAIQAGRDDRSRHADRRLHDRARPALLRIHDP